MRISYLVAYDIASDRRLRKVHKTVREHGTRLQYSVYRCSLTDKELILLRAKLENLINHDEDQVLLIRLGPTGAHRVSTETIGLPFTPESTDSIVI